MIIFPLNTAPTQTPKIKILFPYSSRNRIFLIQVEPPLAGHFYFTAKFLRQVDSMNLKASHSRTQAERRLTFGSLPVLAPLVQDEEDGGDNDDDEHCDDDADDSSDAARYQRNKE